MQKPELSVWMITYNHEKYVKKAIGSVIKQKTTFPIEIVIGDDNSSDNTKTIIKEFADKHSNIKFRFNKTNLGVSHNVLLTLEECEGKYIAMLEGDDYWIDEYKLQKQYDFLENNAEYLFVTTRYLISFDNNSNELVKDKLNHLFTKESKGIKIDKNLFFDYWATKTLTAVIRKEVLNLNQLKKYKLCRDVHIFYHLLSNGCGFCLNFFSGAYNAHGNGIFSRQTQLERLKTSYQVYNDLRRFNKQDLLLKEKYLLLIQKRINKIILLHARPIFYFGLYKLLLEYFFHIRSFKYLWDKLTMLLKRTITVE